VIGRDLLDGSNSTTSSSASSSNTQLGLGQAELQHDQLDSGHVLPSVVEVTATTSSAKGNRVRRHFSTSTGEILTNNPLSRISRTAAR